MFSAKNNTIFLFIAAIILTASIPAAFSQTDRKPIKQIITPSEISQTCEPVFHSEEEPSVTILAYPSDPTSDIGWSAGYSGVSDIQDAFNNARAAENSQLGTSIPMLSLPSQSVWNAMSDGEKALWLINRERMDRGVDPLHGLEENVTSVAQYYADYLLDNDAWGHYEDGNSPWDRLASNSAIGACYDFLNVAENLAYFATSGSSIDLPIERSVYIWMYDDGDCCSWGHRHAILWYPYNDNGGTGGMEGFLGIGRASGPYDSWNYAEMIVMNVFDPCSGWDYGGTGGGDDLIDPTITITDPTTISTYATTSDAISIGGTASDDVGVTAVTWANSRGGSGTCSGTTSWSESGITLYSGSNTITVTAGDAAGNTDTDTLTVTYTPPDTADPTVTITSPTSSSTYATTSDAISIGGTASDDVGVTTVTWSNSRGGSGTCSGTTSWSESGITLYSGSNTITVTAGDAAGNTDTDTLTVTYTPPDTADPTVTITSPTSSSTYATTSDAISIGGTASDDVGVTTVTWSNSRGESGTCSGTTSWSESGITLYSGSNTITVIAGDAAGNTGADTLTVTYTPPDTDGDGVPDNEDQCPGQDDNLDVDADGIPDGCDSLIDSDDDGVGDSEDLCPGNDDSIDIDNDGIPDGCDDVIDSDDDGIADAEDICPGNDDNVDEDNDGIPDGCDDVIGSDDDPTQTSRQGFDYLAYLAANPDLPSDWGMAECMSHYKLFGFWENRAVTLNLEEYLNANPDLPKSWTYEEALIHYNVFGKNENRLIAFDAQEYLSLYPDLPRNWTYDQAYAHYIYYGKQEGRVVSFDETAYLELYPDLPLSWGQAEAFLHYLLFGRSEGRVYDPYDEDVFLTD